MDIFALVIFGLYQCMIKILKSHKNEQNLVILNNFLQSMPSRVLACRQNTIGSPIYKSYTIHMVPILQRLSFLLRLNTI